MAVTNDPWACEIPQLWLLLYSLKLLVFGLNVISRSFDFL